MPKAQIEAFFKKHITSRQKIAIAVSGGSDSLCLAALLCDAEFIDRKDIICLLVDHKLRPESTSEAIITRQTLSSIGLNAEILTWDHRLKNHSNLMSKARSARYKLLTDYCKAHNIKYLLLAHHAEDQAETLMLRIKRGTGVKGLAGMRASSKRSGITLLRPLLDAHKEELQNYLLSKNIAWIEDPSNSNHKFERAKIRDAMRNLGNIDLWVKRLNLLASNAARAERCLENLTTKSLTNCTTFHQRLYFTMNLEKFSALDEEIALRVLLKIIKKTSHKTKGIRLTGLIEIYKHITCNTKLAKTFAGCEFRRYKGNFLIFRELRDIQPTQLKNEYISPLGKERFNKIKSQVKAIHSAPLEKILYLLPCIEDEIGIKLYNKPINHLTSL